MKNCLWLTLALLLATFVGVISYRQRMTENIVKVSVFRDRDSDSARELDHRFLMFNETKNVSSGKRVLIATLETNHYRRDFSRYVALKPSLIVPDSRADGEFDPIISREMKGAKTVCGPQRDCPAFIPSWVSGEELEAAQTLLAFLAE